MNPMIQSRSSRSAWERLNLVQSPAELCLEFNALIETLMPFECELYFPARVRSDLDKNKTIIKTNSDFVQELAQRFKQPQDASTPADSSVFTLPIVQSGRVVAICSLRRKTSDFLQLSPPQIFDLISTCDSAGKSIARLNESHAAEIVTMESSSQRSPGSIFSKVMGTVAHDLRTPITVIRGFIKMILDGRAGPVPESQRKCLEVAFESVHRLVEFSGTVGGAATFLENFQAEDFEIREVWTSVSSAIRSQLEEKGVSVNEFIEPGMIVSGDRGLLYEVIEKSILSMITSIPDGGRLRVEISRRASGDVSLQISLPEEQECANPAEVVTQLQPVVLIHGGRLSFAVKPESGAVLNIILPGYSA